MLTKWRRAILFCEMQKLRHSILSARIKIVHGDRWFYIAISAPHILISKVIKMAVSWQSATVEFYCADEDRWSVRVLLSSSSAIWQSKGSFNAKPYKTCAAAGRERWFIISAAYQISPKLNAVPAAGGEHPLAIGRRPMMRHDIFEEADGHIYLPDELSTNRFAHAAASSMAKKTRRRCHVANASMASKDDNRPLSSRHISKHWAVRYSQHEMALACINRSKIRPVPSWPSAWSYEYHWHDIKRDHHFELAAWPKPTPAKYRAIYSRLKPSSLAKCFKCWPSKWASSIYLHVSRFLRHDAAEAHLSSMVLSILISGLMN